MPAGVEATISYGASKSNAELLRDYGFVVPGNVNDRVSFHAVDEVATGSQLALNPVSLMQVRMLQRNVGENGRT